MPLLINQVEIITGSQGQTPEPSTEVAAAPAAPTQRFELSAMDVETLLQHLRDRAARRRAH